MCIFLVAGKSLPQTPAAAKWAQRHRVVVREPMKTPLPFTPSAYQASPTWSRGKLSQ